MSGGVVVLGGVNPFPGPPQPPEPPDNTAQELVSQGWVTAQDYARDAFDRAVSFLETLKDLADDVGNLPDLNVSIGPITSQLIPYDAPDVVAQPEGMELDLPLPPTRPNLDILDQTIATLQTWVAGISTGIEAAVENQIWDRGRARENAATQRRVMDVTRGFASKGFAKPPGALSLELADALQEQQNKESTFNRDVAIEQAKLEQANRHFAIENIVRVASAIIQIYATDMSAYVSQVDAEVKRATGIANIYESQTRAFVAQVQGATSETESSAKVYEAESRVVGLQAQINVEVLKATVSKMVAQLNSLVEIAKGGAQVSAQLAASALSAVNLSGGISASTSDSRSQSSSNSVSAGVSFSESASITQSVPWPD